MEFSRLETVMFVGLGEINSPGWTWKMDTWVTDITFMLAFLSKTFVRETHIGYMAILLSLIT